MLRKLGIGILATALMAPGFAFALGVGDYKLDSYLNQPLAMDVELLQARDLSPEEIKVSLASQEDFDRAGVDRVYFLTDLDFSVELEDDGTGNLHIKTAQPVREPFLSFLVEIRWPTGRMLREYTVLLDPPSYAPEEPANVSSPESGEAVAEPVQEEQAVEAASSEMAPTAQSMADTDQSAEQGVTVVGQSEGYESAPAPDSYNEYVVQNSDTMWRIASNHRADSSVSIQQMLVAIQELNPDAFIDGNVNLVREGQVLRIPTEQEVRRISTRDALREVAEQNRKWEDMLKARGIPVPKASQVDGTRRSVDRSGPDAQAQEGEVTLVAGTDDSQGGVSASGSESGAGGTDTRALQNELAIREEGIDSLERENRELQSRLDDLQGQVHTSEKLLKLRNDQIAQLQQQLNELQQNQGVEVTDPEPLAELEEAEKPQAEQPMDAAQEEEPDAEMTVETEEAAGNEQGSESAEGADAADAEGEVAVAEPVTRPAGEEAIKPAPEPVEQTTAPKPAPQSQPQQSGGIMDLLMANLLYIVVGVVALLVLLLVIVFMARRKRQESVADDQPFYDEEAGDADEYGAAFMDDDQGEDVFEEDEGQDTSAAQEPAQDPMEEVEVYVAYGRYPQAIDFLRNEIQKTPERSDLRLKLLEVLVETGDSSAFETEAEELSGIDSSMDGQVQELRARLGGGAPAAPADESDDLSLDDLEMDLAADDSDDMDLSADFGAEDGEDETLILDQGAGQQDSEDQEDDFDLELDEEPAADDTFELDSELDFSADLDEPTVQQPAVEPETADSSEDAGLDFDLDVDDADDTATSAPLELDEDVADLDTPAAASEEETSSFDLDDGFDLDTDTASGEDLDVSLDGVSDEFAEAAEEAPAEEELDLSLDDLSLEEDEPTVTTESLDFDEAPAQAPELDPAAESPTVEADAVESPEPEDETVELSLPDLEEDLPAAEPEPELEVAAPAAEPAPAASDDEDDFDFLDGADENATKLDLAKAYIDMGDSEGAKDILNEVIEEGNDAQQAEARDLLSQVS